MPFNIEVNELEGLMFPNNKARDNPKAPQWKGTLKIDGVEYNIAEWEGIGKNSGKPYRRLKVDRGR